MLTSKIFVNENAPNRHIAPKYQKSPESCIIPQITPKFERLIHLPYSPFTISAKFSITYAASSIDILVFRGSVISFSNR